MQLQATRARLARVVLASDTRAGRAYNLVVFGAIIFILCGGRNRTERPDVLPISEVASAAADGDIEKISVSRDNLTIKACFFGQCRSGTLSRLN